MTLFIKQSLVDGLIQHAQSEHPLECCGILVGSREGETLHVDRFIRANNIADGKREYRYLIDFKTLFATVRGVRVSGEHIIGFYHSHTNDSETPSPSDREYAWIDHAYVIVTRTNEPRPVVSSWRMRAAGTSLEREDIVTM